MKLLLIFFNEFVYISLLNLFYFGFINLVRNERMNITFVNW